MERISTVQARTLTASLSGASAFPVIIEADVGSGLARFSIVGLPDSAVRESADRVRSAITRSGVTWPAGRIVINLAPADLRKGGSGLDLGIALALLAAAGKLAPRRLRYAAFHGELSLTGTVREAGGALAVARAVAQQGARLLLTAPGCSREAALEPRLRV
ncbi:MAG: magnesium chelatase domain-containing protein, partial [Acidobacteriota bacterium]